MDKPFDPNTLARSLFTGLRDWLSAEPTGRPATKATEPLSAARDRAVDAVAERYRRRSDAMREALGRRRAALADDPSDDEDRPDVRRARKAAAEALTRRMRFLEKTKNLGATQIRARDRQAPALSSPPPDRRKHALKQVLEARSRRGKGGAGPTRRGKSAGPGEKRPKGGREMPVRPVREIPGIGEKMEARLKDAGVEDAGGVADLPADRLAGVLKTSRKQADKIRKEARRLRRRGR